MNRKAVLGCFGVLALGCVLSSGYFADDSTGGTLVTEPREADYKIVEVSPDANFSEFEILASGSETMDLASLSMNTEDAKKLIELTGAYEISGDLNSDYVNIDLYNASEDYRNSQNIVDYTEFSQLGFYSRVLNGEGNYSANYLPVVSSLETYVHSSTTGSYYKSTGSEDESSLYYKIDGGYYSKTLVDSLTSEDGVSYDYVVSFSFVGEGNGDWSWYPATSGRHYEYDDGNWVYANEVQGDNYVDWLSLSTTRLDTGVGSKIKSTIMVYECKDESSGVLQMRSKELFKRDVLHLTEGEYDSVKVDVECVTPDNLTEELVADADVLYFSNALTSESELYDLVMKYTDADKSWSHSLLDYDITDSVRDAIFNRTATDYQNFTLILDKNLCTDITGECNSNLAKLYMLSTVTYPSVVKSSGMYGALVNSSVSLTSIDDFILTDGKDIYGEAGSYSNMLKMGIDNPNLSASSIAEHGVLTVDGSVGGIISYFSVSSIAKSDTTEEACTYIGSDNISISQALDYLVNAQVTTKLSTPEVRVLEIQPCCSYTTNFWGWRLKGVDPYYTGTASVKQMQSKEFVGYSTDLSSEYDLIYLGANTGTMNTEVITSVKSNENVVRVAESGSTLTVGVSELVNSINSHVYMQEVTSGNSGVADGYIRGNVLYVNANSQGYAKLTIKLVCYDVTYYADLYVIVCDSSDVSEIPDWQSYDVSGTASYVASTWYSVDYVYNVLVQGGALYSVDCGSSLYPTVTFMDKDENVLSTKEGAYNFKTPQSCKYISLSFRKCVNGNPVSVSSSQVMRLIEDYDGVTINKVHSIYITDLNIHSSIASYWKKGEYVNGVFTETSGTSYVYRDTELIRIKPNSHYGLHKQFTDLDIYMTFYDSNGDEVSSLTMNKMGICFTTPSNASFMKIHIKFDASKYTLDEVLSRLKLEFVDVTLTNQRVDTRYIAVEEGSAYTVDLNKYFTSRGITNLSIKLGSWNYTNYGVGLNGQFLTIYPNAVDTIQLENVTITYQYDVIQDGDVTDVINGRLNLGVYVYPSEVRPEAAADLFHTIYNDTSMNGLIYAHVGDTALISDSKLNLTGILYGYKWGGLSQAYYDSLSFTTRFSGNDITLRKCNELKQFIQTGKPVIVAGDFFNGDELNTYTLDSSSYVYKFINESGGSSLNDNAVVNYDFSYLADNDFSVEFSSVPVVYRDYSVSHVSNGTVSFSGYEDIDDYGSYQYNLSGLGISDWNKENWVKCFYLNGEDDTNRTLSYTFEIDANGSSSSSYTVSLYADVTSDGKFTSADELTGVTIRTESGKSVNSNKLESGVKYTLTKELTYDYSGVVHWQVEVTRNDNSALRVVHDSYTAIKSSDDNRRELNVLQIIPAWNETNWNLETDQEFLDLIAEVDEFDVSIYARRQGDLISWSGIKSPLIVDGEKQLEFSDIDMIVVGYADFQNYATEPVLLEAINDFIDEGKAVLFTHDTMSFNNSKGTSYYLTKYFRTIQGQDRYGVNLRYNDARPVYDNLYTTADSSSLLVMYYDILGLRGTSRYKAFAQAALADGKDVAYRAGTGQSLNNLYTEIEGLTDTIIMRSIQYGDGQLLPITRNIIGTSDWSLYNSQPNCDTGYVTCVNRGQITNYPYLIKDNIQVSGTHTQYYQLDMEDEEMNVWYCLGGSQYEWAYSGYLKYNVRDTRNDYYIYNVGNITYSGVGHSAVTNTDEKKLFVNTLISAYRASVSSPNIEVSNYNSETVGNTTYLYLDYDVTEPTKLLDTETEGDYFLVSMTLNDKNAVYNKSTFVKFFSDEALSNEISGLIVYDNTQGAILTSESFSCGGKVYSGYYRINGSPQLILKVPVSVLNSVYGDSASSDKFVLPIYMQTLLTYGTDDKSVSGVQRLILVKRGLFDIQ